MAECKHPPLVVIAGPTASGKTALSIELASRHNGEIISADSMQIYKGMDIGTAKPTVEEMRGVPHHLISVLDNSESFSVAQYQGCATASIQDVLRRGKLPFLVGGTGLYISSVVDNTDFGEIVNNPELRAELEERARQEGGEVLLKELQQCDPVLAKALHPNNLGRIIRALEVYRLTGKPLSEFQAASRLKPAPYNLCMIGLTFRSRELLYQRIDSRVDAMLQGGLLQEVEALMGKGLSATAVQAIGYKELYGYFKGEQTLSQAADNLKRQTRRYAKRQLTWFRRDERVQWLYNEDNDLVGRSEEILRQHGIL
ncbi:tRNA (adenosine(37)-N6)-dimethylallyltransferase MiaA [Acetanaerobacterium elongatum]|uniref:tRNA dimethylallyltransferase n=1 Tax=Acetanaerobacterium elongatum TaxID=258515 RepID=A0A1G9X2R8_9FIRM|nr:tRNA (adenosine(37)-N6)-dimethylallyltransferase MiaA [Acetanaerobacterium elongatum]SDM91030.1 tRNA dimethylallyltransferase [Acetanaerobacterium elongatum]